jgi:leader peptidase (prepilin peptidase) / N-methyltransferase
METVYKAIGNHEFGGRRKSPVAVSLRLGVFNILGTRYRRMMATQVFFTLVLFGVLGAITWIDFRTQTIPDFLIAVLAVGGIAGTIALNAVTLGDAVLGLIIGIIAPLGLRSVFEALRGMVGLGLGDVKFLGAAGVWIGASGLPWVVLIASLSGLTFALAVQLVQKNFTRQTRLAFGPHLALGLFLTWIFKLYGML